MSDTVETAEMDLLLVPISGEKPVGEYLRYEGTYDRIQEARREDDPELPMGVWETNLKRADWGLVEELCVGALRERTKDLQIAIWLLEARISLHGFAGVRSGLRLINALCETFWDGLYPEPQDGDMEYRLSPLEWMNEKLSIKLGRIPITRPGTPDGISYNSIDLKGAQKLENLATKNPSVLNEAASEGAVTMARFNGSLVMTPDDFYHGMERELRECLEQLAVLELFLDDRCGRGAPSFRSFAAGLQGALDFAVRTLRSRGTESGSKQEQEKENGEVPAVALAASERGVDAEGNPVLLIRSRAEAYGMLSAIADYLTSVEPHSPTPYLIKRAVSWGSMPLALLLQELTSDGGDLASVFRLLGIRETGE